MRALLLALLFTATTSGCSSKKEAGKQSPQSASAATTHRQAEDNATDVEQARNAAKDEAATAQTAADVTATAAHDEAAAQLQKEFDAADRRFNALKEKAANATGAKKKQADAAVANIMTRETTVMAGIAKLRDATGASWDTTKTQVDADRLALDKAIQSLDMTLQ